MAGLSFGSLLDENRDDIEYLEERVYDEKADLEEWCRQIKKRLDERLIHIIDLQDSAETFKEIASDAENENKDSLTDEQEKEIEKQKADCDRLYEEADGLYSWVEELIAGF